MMYRIEILDVEGLSPLALAESLRELAANVERHGPQDAADLTDADGGIIGLAKVINT